MTIENPSDLAFAKENLSQVLAWLERLKNRPADDLGRQSVEHLLKGIQDDIAEYEEKHTLETAEQRD